MKASEAPDRGFMTTALAMAARGLGSTAPNPSVGCVIVKSNVIVGRGHTQPGGRPHAETEALAQAGDLARGATAYVTLEPCCHHGQTPPCTDALISAGVSRVVIANTDPDDRVDGGGVDALRRAGIEVVTGVLESAAQKLNAGFFKCKRHGVPYIAFKTASTLDGRIALANGESQWITGGAARRYGHLLRSKYDGILIGSSTALADDPQLTSRLPGYSADQSRPVRVVLDRRLRISFEAKVVQTAQSHPTWVVTSDQSNSDKAQALERVGVQVMRIADSGNQAFARATAVLLAKQGLTRVLIEGGGQVAASFLQEHLVDRIYAFQAPKVIGGDGLSAVGGLGLTQMSDVPQFERMESRVLGPDCLEILEREPTV